MPGSSRRRSVGRRAGRSDHIRILLCRWDASVMTPRQTPSTQCTVRPSDTNASTHRNCAPRLRGATPRMSSRSFLQLSAYVAPGPGEPRRIHARPAIQIVDLETRIIADRGDARPRECFHGFLHRILLEGRRIFDRAGSGRMIVKRRERDRHVGKEVAELLRLVRIVGSEQKVFHDTRILVRSAESSVRASSTVRRRSRVRCSPSR
ncbi:MAG: hypothetical protein MZV64_49170 [Ignavibacteriales bacterium]|nr:hypothetical protein [Ignavibacteriales bacterium]